MIRPVRPTDAKSITDIYNVYIMDSTATFETEPLLEKEMQKRIASISNQFPYYVFESEDIIAGYCYAHLWKERAAYKSTLEVTVYLHPEYLRKGIGKQLMTKLIDECRKMGYHALIACITEGNEASISLYKKLDFKQVSCFVEVGLKFGKKLDVSDFELIL